jgi:23S rRNA pseudouridine1911/1915/1917 synthase
VPDDFSAITLTASAGAASQRLDRFLFEQLAPRHAGLSRSRIQALIADGLVLVDSSPAKSSLKLRGSELITITGPLTAPPITARAEKIPLDVIYEDAQLAVVNKPAGMMVHAGSGQTDEARSEGTLVNALLARFKTLSSIGGELRPGIVHRLDKETSGLLVIAKNDKAHERLAAMFARREIKKTYIALVQGWLAHDSGTIDSPLGRDPQRRTRMTAKPVENARSAITHYAVQRRLETRFGKFTLLRVRIETGRTHQIRVHLASINHPVVGDKLYGAAGRIAAQQTGPRRLRNPEFLSLGRNFLHAAELEFTHPGSGKPLHFTAPLPPELEAFLARLEAPAG